MEFPFHRETVRVVLRHLRALQPLRFVRSTKASRAVTVSTVRKPTPPLDPNSDTSYAVKAPFAFVAITDDHGIKRYVVSQPELGPAEKEHLRTLKEYLLEGATSPLAILHDPGKAEAYLQDEANQLIRKHKLKIPAASLDSILYYLTRDFLGYGQIDPLMRDQLVEDVSCDGAGLPIYVWHRKHESLPTNVVFADPHELNAYLSRLAYRAGGQITVSRPLFEGTLPEGYRLHLTLDEISKRGSTFTIRKFLSEPLTMIDLLSVGALTPQMAAYFWMLVEYLRSIVVVGPTASGKTTTIGSIAMFIPPERKIITIEETREIRLPQENWIPLQTRPTNQEGAQEVTLFELLKTAMRQRPDYIIVGEVRGEEAYTLFQAISIGHGGIATMHADSVRTAIRRLLTKPMNIPAVLIPLMNVVVLMGRVQVKGQNNRRVLDVVEVVGVDEKRRVTQLNKVFEWQGAQTDSFTYKGKSFLFERIAETQHLSPEKLYEELRRREKVLQWMRDRKTRRYQEVASIIRRYYTMPDETLRLAEQGAPPPT